MRMPFGKYRDWPLDEVPSSYLRWLRDACDLRPWLAEAVEQVLADRDALGRDRRRDAARDAEKGEGGLPPGLDAVIRQLHREMALLFHPDRGGSVIAMQAINAAIDRLKELVAQRS